MFLLIQYLEFNRQYAFLPCQGTDSPSSKVGEHIYTYTSDACENWWPSYELELIYFY